MTKIRHPLDKILLLFEIALGPTSFLVLNMIIRMSLQYCVQMNAIDKGLYSHVLTIVAALIAVGTLWVQPIGCLVPNQFLAAWGLLPEAAVIVIVFAIIFGSYSCGSSIIGVPGSNGQTMFCIAEMSFKIAPYTRIVGVACSIAVLSAGWDPCDEVCASICRATFWCTIVYAITAIVGFPFLIAALDEIKKQREPLPDYRPTTSVSESLL